MPEGQELEAVATVEGRREGGAKNGDDRPYESSLGLSPCHFVGRLSQRGPNRGGQGDAHAQTGGKGERL